MGTHRWADLEKGKLPAETRARLKREAADEVMEMTLRALREAAGKTQEEMAGLTEMSQSQLSRFERREDFLLSTLRRYVEALGGELELVAVVKGKRVRLRAL
ncbi:MAG: helix-turn-helix transcriptional regulator [Polyangiaceae bacterium]